MYKFAKLFDFEELKAQVLFYHNYNADDDETILHQIVDIDGIRADVKLVFSGKTQHTDVQKILRNINEKYAKKMYKKVLETLG